MSNWPQQSEAAGFYGSNIRISKGAAGPDPKWERDNLVTVPLPWRAVASWDHGLKIRSIRIHKRCAESLTRVLDAVWTAFDKNQKAIEIAGMHLIGGGYVWRAMRGSSRLSMHAYGCAVDFDPDRNGLGDPTPAMDKRVVEAFKAEGWNWGGDWSPQRRDGMHFQAAVV
ncbi:MAG: M15 family metallopeptidase [Hyphomicrobiales bacterium]|nr:M15 family metallopeptidase [Hyphomicrobiales bacterium]